MRAPAGQPVHRPLRPAAPRHPQRLRPARGRADLGRAPARRGLRHRLGRPGARGLRRLRARGRGGQGDHPRAGVGGRAARARGGALGHAYRGRGAGAAGGARGRRAPVGPVRRLLLAPLALLPAVALRRDVRPQADQAGALRPRPAGGPAVLAARQRAAGEPAPRLGQAAAGGLLRPDEPPRPPGRPAAGRPRRAGARGAHAGGLHLGPRRAPRRARLHAQERLLLRGGRRRARDAAPARPPAGGPRGRARGRVHRPGADDARAAGRGRAARLRGHRPPAPRPRRSRSGARLRLRQHRLHAPEAARGARPDGPHRRLEALLVHDRRGRAVRPRRRSGRAPEPLRGRRPLRRPGPALGPARRAPDLDLVPRARARGAVAGRGPRRRDPPRRRRGRPRRARALRGWELERRAGGGGHLFHLASDPGRSRDRFADPASARRHQELEELLVGHLAYGLGPPNHRDPDDGRCFD